MLPGLRRPFRRAWSFFHRLQWKLTLAYALSTVITVLILGVVGVAILWYLNFRSNWLAGLIADGLNRATPSLTPYLDQTPPDRQGLQQWLQDVTLGDNLVIEIPREDAKNENDVVPAQFGRIVSVAIVDDKGRLLAAIPADRIDSAQALQAEFSPEAAQGFQAALQGETDPELLSTRDQAGHMLATAPIFGTDGRVAGAIFVKSAFPVETGEFLRTILQELVLPVAGGMLVAGVFAGILFGYIISRGLTGRLKMLDQAAAAWSRGNFEVLAPDTSADELGYLARHFNYMAIQLQNLLQTRQGLATLEERNRLARDLHDSVKQQVFATAMQVGAAKALIERDPAAAKIHLSEAEQLVRQAQQELTSLIKELRPAALEGKGLARALRDYVGDWSRRSQITAEVRIRGERPLPLPLEQTLFRVAQEALANITRHSQADLAEVELAWEGQKVTLTIIDNGRGFNPAGPNGKGVGLQSMRERIESVGGSLNLANEPGGGVCITAEVVINN